MGKKLVISGILLAAVAAGIWYWLRPAEASRTYRFVEIERGDLESVVAATGTLEPVTTVSVGTQVSGQIAEIYVDFNDRVKAGQVIARLDKSVLESAVEEAQATLRRNRAQKVQAEIEYRRLGSLYEQGIVAQHDLDLARQDLDVTSSNLESAEAALARAKRNLGYATIYSPISGTVISRSVDVGQTVAASFSAPELFRVAADLSKMQILAAVDESDIGQIHEGQDVRFRVQAFPDRDFHGRVRQVRLQPETQENVVSYTVVVDADNPDGELLPGMTATVDFLVSQARAVLKVANAALRFRPTDSMRAELMERLRARGGLPRGETGEGTDHGEGRGEGREGGGGGGRGEVREAGTPAREGRTPATGEREGSARSDGTSAGRPSFGGSGSFGGFGGRSDRTLLWTLDPEGQVRATPVRIGITDGQMTEISGRDLEPGTQVIVGVTEEAPSGFTNPFQSQERRGSRFRRPGGVG
jgi:HlyD family secretion protein